MDSSRPAKTVEPGWRQRWLARCSRETASGSFVPQIDGLRSLAIVSVLFFHLDDILRYTAPLGTFDRALASVVRRGLLGVPIFFAISAFIVSLPFAKHWLASGPKVSWQRFYLRRLTRLEPPYILSLVAVWLLGAASGWWELPGMIPHLFASLIYQHNLLFGNFNPYTTVVWSLEVEFQFYFLAPLLTVWFAIRQPGLRRALLVISVLAIVGLRPPESRRVELSLLGQWEWFAAGLLAADVYLTTWRTRLPTAVAWDAAGTVAWIAFFALTRVPDPQVRNSLQAALLFVAVLGSLGGRRLGAFFGNPWVFTFGGMCYSYYLWHQTFMAWGIAGISGLGLLPSSYGAQMLLASLLVMPMVLVACLGFFLVTEKPFMRRDWPERFMGWLRRQPRQAG